MRIFALLLVATFALTGCEKTPTGRSQLALVPDSYMTEIGQQAFAQMKDRMPLARDTAASGLVRCVAEEVVAAADRVYPSASMPESWEIVVFDNPSPNAFALPGGRIGVNTGLLDVAETPSQLAAVIGHEVGHVLADHGNERLTQELGIKAGLMLVGLIGEGGLEEAQLLQVLGIGARIGVALPFSRAHEREADVMGLKIMSAAGFDPRASVALWRNMSAQGGEQPPELLSTHPAHESRIEELQAHMESARQRYRDAPAASCRSG